MDISKDRGRRVAVRRLVGVVPLVLLSASWTVSVADVGAAPGAGATDSPAAAVQGPAAHADVPLPDAVVEPPASVARPDGMTAQAGRAVPASASSPVDIPSTALAAYQRAAAVIGAADERCHLDWALVAAIGRVESDHGRVSGSALDAAGLARPAIIGPALDGKNGTTLVSDTDAGALDGDKAYDHAVGPLQFIPTTWGVVGVDADDDGRRNPQDIDDAALATAVYLCSGDADLAVPDQLAAAVHRYNHSSTYVALVLRVMKAYAAGVPTGTVPSGFTPPQDADGQTQAAARSPKGGTSGGGGQQAAQPPADGPTPASPAGPRPGDGGTAEPVPTGEPTPSPAGGAIAILLTRTEAVLQCTLRGLSRLLDAEAFSDCIDELTGGA